jgi:obg-like ATPase 1
LIPYSGAFENNLAMLQSDEEKAEYIKKLSEEHKPPVPLASTLPKIIVTGYNALQLIYFFTGGPDEVRAWTIRKNTKAPQAAGTIHTDFEKAFVMAEVMKYDDLHELSTEAAVKAAGKYVQKGKEYIVLDGDIVYFKVGTIQKKK